MVPFYGGVGKLNIQTKAATNGPAKDHMASVTTMGLSHCISGLTNVGGHTLNLVLPQSRLGACCSSVVMGGSFSG